MVTGMDAATGIAPLRGTKAPADWIVAHCARMLLLRQSTRDAQIARLETTAGRYQLLSFWAGY